MTRVLITNDDGVAAPGLRWLARTAVDTGLDVVVAAPAQETSGTSAAMSAYTADGRVIIRRHSLPDLDGVPAYGVAASPSYIVVLAMLATFGEPPNLVLSGINRGANAGRAVLHSGTVGAALTAAAYSIPAMAVSLDVLSPASELNTGGTAATSGNALEFLDTVDDEARNWGSAAAMVPDLLHALDDAPAGTVLNLNVPDLPAERVRGLRRASLARFGQVQMAVAETGEDFVRMAVEQSRGEAVPGTDLAWLSERYATITAIRPPSEVEDVAVPGVPLDADHEAVPGRPGLH
ncbi:MAG: 5'/3'-nucleotidase SurE [Micromonosporaceae bacterium]